MWSDWVALLTVGVGITLASPLALDASSDPHSLKTRNIVDKIADSYDFVIVGGGLAGLVLGARLSEDSNHTVLVLEAGGNGDDHRQQIDVPGYSYYKSLWQTPLNWGFVTTPQTYANNSELLWPRGKVLGGSSAINGLYMTRPGEIEINAWKDMLGDMNGADSWSWDSFYPALKKSENFSPPDGDVAQEGDITWNAASHGSNGPIHMTWPGYTFPMVGKWSTAAASCGVTDSQDPYGGQNWGAYASTSCINPTNWTRSYSRSGYLDPLPPRANYDVLVNAHVTRLLFNSTSSQANLTANAVEYTSDNGATKLTVKVKKEVILAGGSVGSPAVLLYSGIGPKDVLGAAGVPLVAELPGVGQHLQDHLSVSVQWNTNVDTAGSIFAEGGSKSTDPKFLSYINSAIAYVNSSVLFGAGVGSLQSSVLGQLDSFTASSGSYDAGVIAGEKAIYNVVANNILTSPLGQVELLIGNDLDGATRIGAALQHPFSTGSITINSSNPVDYPVIDPGYLRHAADVQILREGIKLARRIGESPSFHDTLTEETWPGTDVQSDDEWDTYIRGNGFTEFHPSSTCAMLPRDLGGVVDANLRVYGLSNVRVADASVPPISFSSHLMSSTYGIAEQASTIIRKYHNIRSTSDSSKSSNTTSAHSSKNNTATATGSSSSSSASASGSAQGGGDHGNGVSSLHAWPAFFAAVMVGTVSFLLL